MKTLFLILAILFAVPNFSFASVQSYELPIEKTEKKKSRIKNKRNRTYSLAQNPVNTLEVGYYITYGGLMMQTLSLLLSTDPLIAAVMLLIGLIIALVGLIIVGISLNNLKKQQAN